jgi:bifunctional non-homologous end joining protein LigD
MSLAKYHRKRDFSKTPEPRGGTARDGKPLRRFVVQKHAARRLHYDFRLEFNGVLKSWALPKGPSLDPGVKRLAVQVEDHPLEYADFEGVIPEGEYGAGTVLIWDRGAWVPEGDPVEAYEHGSLEFELKGERLRGRWILLRMGGQRNRKYWLLIKERDAEARPGSGDAVVTRNQTSIATGRDIDMMAAARDHSWL